LEIISGLRDALDHDQLHLVFQPKIKLDDGRTIGSEALLRWTHPEEGLISPAEFIPVAETAGLSVPIGDWVLRQTCMQLSAWRSEGLPILPVSVNLSATQFADRSLIEKVRNTLTEFSIDPTMIEFEITETAIMNDLDLAIEVMQSLVNLGSQLSIDDFGTGYSSFGYLRRLPITEIKIDRSFVAEIVESTEDRAILRAMIDLGHSLDLVVLSEGVETQEQYDLLRSIKCDHAQGFLMCRPIEPEAFADKLRSQPGVEPKVTAAKTILATTDN
jgi:EAL domain-containing protein (putative c-di-GMP-specific phosphodiesterase class I)